VLGVVDMCHDLLSPLKRAFFCFKGGFLSKFCPYVWLVFKSGL
jgi:hypothetical protein